MGERKWFSIAFICHAFNDQEHGSGSSRPDLSGICKAPQKSRHKISDTSAL